MNFRALPPPRYADRGKKGYLNIVLKKRTDGGQVYLWGRSAVNTAFVDANLRASYHQGASQFTLAYNPTWRNYQKVYDNISESYIGKDFRVDLETSDRNPFYYHNHNVMLKYDLSPNPQTLFSATFGMAPGFRKSRAIGTTSDSFLGDYHNNNLTTNKTLSPSLDLYFKREFNQANFLEAQVVGTSSSDDYRRENDYLFSDGATSDYIMDVDSRRHSLISEISYTHLFGMSKMLSAGYQNTVSRSTNTYLSSDYKPVLTENNNYIYLQFAQQINRVYYSLSTGAKLYWIKNDLNHRHFIRNLTTLQFNWNISQQWNIGAAFQYTPGIPSLSWLTDYPQQQTPYLISNGNPDLKVTQHFNYQLIPSFQYKKFTASLLMNYQDALDFVMNDMFYLGNRMFLTQSINAKRSWGAAGTLNLKLSNIYGFGVNLNLSVQHAETLGQDWCHHLTSFSASFNIWWNKGPFTISYWRKIPGKYLAGNSIWKDENGDALTFDYRPDKHWTIGASWMYMFDRKGTKYPQWCYSSINPSFRERYIENNGNMVTLTVSYTADFGTIFRPHRRSLNNADNNSSLLQL